MICYYKHEHKHRQKSSRIARQQQQQQIRNRGIVFFSSDMETLLWQELCFIVLIVFYIETNVSVPNALLPMHSYVLWFSQPVAHDSLIFSVFRLALLWLLSLPSSYTLYFLLGFHILYRLLWLLCRIFK